MQFKRQILSLLSTGLFLSLNVFPAVAPQKMPDKVQADIRSKIQKLVADPAETEAEFQQLKDMVENTKKEISECDDGQYIMHVIEELYSSICILRADPGNSNAQQKLQEAITTLVSIEYAD